MPLSLSASFARFVPLSQAESFSFTTANHSIILKSFIDDSVPGSVTFLARCIVGWGMVLPSGYTQDIAKQAGRLSTTKFSTCIVWTSYNYWSEKNNHVIPSKSCDLDPIPTILLKACLDVLIKPITDIINASLCYGFFPDDFKCAHVNPVLKKPTLPKEELNS